MNESRESTQSLSGAAAPFARGDAEALALNTGGGRSPSPGSEKEERYRQIFENLQVPILLIDPETARIVECNTAAAAFYGTHPDALSRMSLWDLNALTQEELFRELLQSASRGQRLFMVRQRLPNGDVRDVEIAYSPVRAGERGVLSALLRDLTRPAGQDDAAARAEALKEAVTEGAFQLLAGADYRTGLRLALDGFGAVHGLCRLDLFECAKTVDGQPLMSHRWQWSAKPKQLDSGDPRMRAVPLADLVPFSLDMLRAGPSVVCPVRDLVPPLATMLEAEASRTALLVPVFTGDDLRTLLVAGDSAPDKKWQEREVSHYRQFASCLTAALIREGVAEGLRRTGAQYRSLVESSEDVLFQTDSTGLWTVLSPSWTYLTGFTTEESIGEFWLSNVHHEDRQSAALDFQAMLEGEKPAVRREVRLTRKDGTVRPARLLVRPLRDESGSVTGTTGFLQDAAAEPAEKAVPADDRYRRLFEELSDLIFVATPEGRLLDMNRSGVETLRYSSKDDLLSKNVYTDIFADGRDGRRFSEALEKTGSVRDFDIDVSTKGGEALTLSFNAVRTSAPSLVLYQGIARDVTGKRKQEQELLFTKKMEAVGQLAGGVAHDFNNILTGIRGYAEILRAKVPPESGLTTYVDRIIASSERGAHITEGLMTFSRKRKAKTERTDMDELIENSRPFLNGILGADVRLVIRTSGKKPSVMADRSQIEQVFMHLATNARDAMPQGGLVTVTSAVEQLGTDFRKHHGYGEPGTFIRISFSDTGAGMDARTRERVFEPFFTTREVGRGTGLGLSIVYGIVKQHQGYITVSSTPGEGSTFDIYLPLAVSREEAPRPADFPVPKGGSEIILLAEDDEVVNDLIRSILEGFGYSVISAADGEDAVAKLREHKDRVHLLISDVVMPRKTGTEVYEEVLALRPDLKVIFISGYDEDIACGRGIAEKGLPIIPKPFSTSDLLTRVRAVLDEQPLAQH